MSKTTILEPDLSTRFALGIEYDGSAYKGWQAQKSPAVSTVQEELEMALSSVANQPVKLVCAGRTDSGVHASAQIAHFETTAVRPEKAWVKGANALLAGKISVRWAKQVEDDFHARFSARSRHYRYVIYNNAVRPALMRGLVTPAYNDLKAELMQTAGQYLIGEHDFTSFRGVACQSNTPMRNLKTLSVQRFGDYILIDVIANAFLLHMVRNIVGVLLQIGEGKRSPEWANDVLIARDRSCAGVTAPPDGLYLVAVDYPQHFGLPDLPVGPAWLQAFSNN